MADEGNRASGDRLDITSGTTRPTADDEPYFSDLKLGGAWGESISKRWADELEKALQRWAGEADHSRYMGPFDGEELTGADVFWLTCHVLINTAGSMDLAASMLLQASEDARFRF